MLSIRSLVKFFLFILLIKSHLPGVYLSCYRMKMLAFKTSDTPGYQIEMHLHKNQTLSVIVRVVEEIGIPMWNIVLVQHPSNPLKVLYNTTIKVCNFWRYMKRVRLLNGIAENFFNEDVSNISFKCPLKVGTYFMRNIMLPPDAPLFRFIYVPNAIYTFSGNVYSKLPNKELLLQCSYELNMTVLKSC